MHVYKYIDDIPRDFPTLGMRDVKKGDIVESADEIDVPFLKEVKPAKSDVSKASDTNPPEGSGE